MPLKLYDYWRSSAAYRLRIALQIKGLDHQPVPISLHPDEQAHIGEYYRSLNPQMRIPAIETGGEVFGQSLAILEWLEETWPGRPALLPADPVQRLKARAFAQTIACDIHPLNTPIVLSKLKQSFAATQEQLTAWYADWIRMGFSALETRFGSERKGAFLFDETPGLAEICLVPQLYNARRFNVSVSDFPGLLEIEAACQALPAFQAAAPDQLRPT